ncbi:hypothetical protein MTO96_017863 [Rhipicephalus appendiculatus]
MTRTVVIVCVIVAAARTALSAPKTRASYKSIQDRMQQLSKDFEAHLQDALVPRHCADLLSNGQHTSGVYTLFHQAAGTSGQDVYCDMDTDDGGWTVIQRRGPVRTQCFTTFTGTGLSTPTDSEILLMSTGLVTKRCTPLRRGDEKMVLRVVLSNSTEESVSFDYETFAVASEEEDFQLQVTNFSGRNDLDTMGKLSGQKFSTFDRDNDLASVNCAEKFRGAWWYRICSVGSLNGLNLNGHHDSLGDGIVWEKMYQTPDMMHHSFPMSKMMIRPAK